MKHDGGVSKVRRSSGTFRLREFYKLIPPILYRYGAGSRNAGGTLAAAEFIREVA